MSWLRTFAVCLAGAGCLAQPAPPLRIVVLTRLSQTLPDAAKLFASRWGEDRIVLSYGDAAAPPADLDRADVILAYSLHSEEARTLAPRMKPLLARGVKVVAHWPEGAERHWGLRQDPAVLQQAVDYWLYGGVPNMARLLAFLHTRIAGRSGVPVEPPEKELTTGIYHPRAPAPFASLDTYLRWYGNNKPKVGLLFYHTNLKNRDLAHIDALIGALERKGLGAVAVFGWPPASCEPLLIGPDGPAVEALFALNLGFAKPDDALFLERLNVHVLGLMTTRQAREEWFASPHGVQTAQLALQVAAPERAGATEPITVAATERSADGKATRTVPIDERLQRAVDRAWRWIQLRHKANSRKRVALLYYNSPPGKGNISASYLNVPGSLAAVVERLRDDGYLTGGRMPSERELLDLLERSGRNVEEWAPGELEAMVAGGQVVLISMPQYRQWTRELPPAFLREVERAWGPPESSTLMTIRTRAGQPYFVLPGLRLGNLFLGPQPLRSSFARAAATQHDTSLPPPHSYVAAYLWLRRQFQADAIVHVGRHGTHEFLPGKNTGQAGHDAAEAILGDVPAPYFYILDGGGESMTARRRGSAVIMSHLTPLLAPSGPQEETRVLREALAQYEKTRDESPALAAQYETQARDEARRLKLDAQLGLDLSQSGWMSRVGDFLEETEAAAIPLGVHTLGRLPREELIAELENQDPDFLGHLRVSPARELDATVRVLRGEYLPSGPSGDPLRAPATLPSGRNLHDFDPSLIPTPAACALGRKLGDDLLQRVRRQTGTPARKVSLVLWYGETIRHQGAMECQALHLMGVEPRWNSRGVVDDLRVIPESELGRPRVDVVVTIAGIYRDGFPDKVLLLDRASRLVQAAGGNTLSANTQAAYQKLLAQGVKEDDARRASSARVFGPAPGDYGGGVAHLAKQSLDAKQPGVVAEAYLRHNNHAYTPEGWGAALPHALAAQLSGNQAIVHSRATNLYGVLDNDDFFDFAGGLSAATRSVNGGTAPQLYVANLRRSGAERLADFRKFLTSELHGRVWNPKWIREMQRSGYSGAREIADHIENVYGWQATTPEQVDGSVWQRNFEVYVEDRLGLGLKEFFSKENPHARQYLLARLLEVDRQGSHRFTEAQRTRLVREYLESVLRSGVACSANTCGNRTLQRWIAAEARSFVSPAQARAFLARFEQAFRPGPPPKPVDTAAAPSAGRLRRPFRIFAAVAERYASAPGVVRFGAIVFLMFLGASAALGLAQSYGIRRARRPLVELKLAAD